MEKSVFIKKITLLRKIITGKKIYSQAIKPFKIKVFSAILLTVESRLSCSRATNLPSRKIFQAIWLIFHLPCDRINLRFVDKGQTHTKEKIIVIRRAVYKR